VTEQGEEGGRSRGRGGTRSARPTRANEIVNERSTGKSRTLSGPCRRVELGERGSRKGQMPVDPGSLQARTKGENQGWKRIEETAAPSKDNKLGAGKYAKRPSSSHRSELY